MPPTEDWIDLAALDDIPAAGALSVTHGDKKIALFRHGDRIFALEDWCPHIGAMLSKGVHEKLTITCPLHGVVYSLTTGAALSEPNWGPARRFPARVSGGRVEIDWSKRRYTFRHP